MRGVGGSHWIFQKYFKLTLKDPTELNLNSNNFTSNNLSHSKLTLTKLT